MNKYYKDARYYFAGPEGKEVSLSPGERKCYLIKAYTKLRKPHKKENFDLETNVFYCAYFDLDTLEKFHVYPNEKGIKSVENLVAHLKKINHSKDNFNATEITKEKYEKFKEEFRWHINMAKNVFGGHSASLSLSNRIEDARYEASHSNLPPGPWHGPGH